MGKDGTQTIPLKSVTSYAAVTTIDNIGLKNRETVKRTVKKEVKRGTARGG